MIDFVLNDAGVIRTEVAPGTTVLDFVRYHRHLTGTKIGCREGDCGACTVLVGELTDDHQRVVYRSMTACLLPLANVHGKHVVTVEGINPPGADDLTPVQRALVDENGTQCGFCTVGFVLSLTGYCLHDAPPSPARVLASIDGNICRCTGYKSIERAAGRLNELLAGRAEATALEFAVINGIVPDYFRTLPEALRKLKAVEASKTQVARQPSNSPTLQPSIYVSGGTDLYVQRHEEMHHLPAGHLFDQRRLRGVRADGDFVEIGGAATVTDLLESPVLRAVLPGLDGHGRLVSSTPIRNMATVAGNLVNASPIGDLTSWLLALDATLVLANGQRREVPLRAFYCGYKQLDKTADEVVEAIRFRRPAGQYVFNFEKVCKRTYLDIASVNSSALFVLENGVVTRAGISAGGVAPVPLYLRATSEFLTGKLPDDAVLHQALEILQQEISPISDVRGSAAYKRLLAGQLLRAHFFAIRRALTQSHIS